MESPITTTFAATYPDYRYAATFAPTRCDDYPDLPATNAILGDSITAPAAKQTASISITPAAAHTNCWVAVSSFVLTMTLLLAAKHDELTHRDEE